MLQELLQIAREHWQYRELQYQLTLRDIRVRYKQAVMGFAWALLMPLLVTGAGAIVRLALVHVAGGNLDERALMGVLVKSLPWAFFVGAIGFANASLLSNAHLLTKVYFPREVLPLSAVLAQTCDTLVAAAVLTPILLFLGLKCTLAVLWVPALALLLFMLTAGLALFLSCATLFFRDVKYLVQLFLTFGIFVTPVFFEPSMLGDTGAHLLMLNPLAPLIEGMRISVVDGRNLLTPTADWSPWNLAYSAVWAIAGLPLAALLFHRFELVFAEYA